MFSKEGFLDVGKWIFGCESVKQFMGRRWEMEEE